MGAHWPLVHVLVQHCSALEQEPPMSRHWVEPHLPSWHTLVQHWRPEVQASPELRQSGLGSGQRPFSPHTPVQHWAPLSRLQVAPAFTHCEPGPPSRTVPSPPSGCSLPPSTIPASSWVLGGVSPQSQPTMLMTSASAPSTSQRFPRIYVSLKSDTRTASAPRGRPHESSNGHGWPHATSSLESSSPQRRR